MAGGAAEHGGVQHKALQFHDGQALKSMSAGELELNAGDVITYDTTGSGFRLVLTITAHNGSRLQEPVVLEAGSALAVQQALKEPEKATSVVEKAVEAKPSKEEELKAKSQSIGSGFERPTAVAMSGSGDVTFQTTLFTPNALDRVGWVVRVGEEGSGGVVLKEDRSWWNNPAWTPELKKTKGVDFKEGFGGLAADAPGHEGETRKIQSVVPGDMIKRIYPDDTFKKSSKIVLGLVVWYGAGGNNPAAATKQEFAQAYDSSSRTAHRYGLHGMGVGEHAGIFDLSALDLDEGEWASNEEIFAEGIQDNPSPNIKVAFPEDYPHQALIEPLEPKEGMKMATRIENEATLAVADLGMLNNIIGQLEVLASDNGLVNGIMSGDETLELFNWSVTKDENSMIFTDVYLDDLEHTALRAGVGIRKRSSDTATKLNVKTGPGYQVGELDGDGTETDVKSDIYRRHEIGYDLHPGASIEDIAKTRTRAPPQRRDRFSYPS